jgi:ketosteroid isomerase-like protein
MIDARQDVEELTEAVRAVFAAGEAHDFTRLRGFHLEAPDFSRWSNRPGGPLLDITAAHDEEETAFGSLVPGTRVTPEEIRVDLFGPVAVSTFSVHVRSTEGALLRRTRGTLVWHRHPEGWRIVHEHFSP